MKSCLCGWRSSRFGERAGLTCVQISAFYLIRLLFIYGFVTKQKFLNFVTECSSDRVLLVFQSS